MYIPAASLPSTIPNAVRFWSELSAHDTDWVEIELYTHIEDVLRILILEQDHRSIMLRSLEQIATWSTH